jgi:hypothetical protein
MINARKTTHDGFPALEMIVDEKPVRFTLETKTKWLDEFGLLFLGAEFQKDAKYRHPVPADKENSRGAMVLEGFTNDPEIIAVFREWLGSY